MAKADLVQTLKKALAASPLLTAAANLKPKSSDMCLGCTVKLDKEVTEDLYEWKRGEPMAKVWKHLIAVLKHLDLLDEAMKAMPEAPAIGNETVIVADMDEPDEEPWKEKWASTHIPLMKKGPKKGADTTGSAKASRAQASKGSVATGITQLAKASLYQWCWSAAPLPMMFYSQFLKFLFALPAVGLNFVLGLGILMLALFLCNPEVVGEYLGDCLWAIPAWLGTWGSGVLRGMKRARVAPCPPCPTCKIPAHCLDLGNFTEWVPTPVALPQEPVMPPAAPPIDLAASSFLGACLALLGGRLWGAMGPGHH